MFCFTLGCAWLVYGACVVAVMSLPGCPGREHLEKEPGATASAIDLNCI